MASNSSASETWFGPSGFGSGPGEHPGSEWNPTADSVAPARGRHRVVKQRGGMARSGTVLGVGVIAAVGAGGMAVANEKPPVAISLPDLSQVTEKLPDPESMPGLGSLMSGGSSEGRSAEQAPLTQAGLVADESGLDAGETLRARIMRQAEQQRTAADQSDRHSAEQSAREQAAGEAAERADAERKAEEKAERERQEAAEREAEAKRLAELARSYALPLASYTLTSGFGDSGSMWSNNHTGQDFAAPTGTPVKAVHNGTITQAGWAGSYGYRVVVTLDDGTEVWYCHLSSMTRTSGTVETGETIARVGATGNVTGPHLHLEIRPGGGDPIDPAAWFSGHGKNL
ncbi:M23 family metallopeptidase [Streptomyces sp. TP-A0874]|uniref:M23 family metallopeptidase n=1 Tax=Streptomyces sp. TP-A0874 TaxID=549819 RepID=UPI0008538734|nr:M23 family metallopeptidase [Streptomyces sp. TP-A0874]